MPKTVWLLNPTPRWIWRANWFSRHASMAHNIEIRMPSLNCPSTAGTHILNKRQRSNCTINYSGAWELLDLCTITVYPHHRWFCANWHITLLCKCKIGVLLHTCKFGVIYAEDPLVGCRIVHFMLVNLCQTSVRSVHIIGWSKSQGKPKASWNTTPISTKFISAIYLWRFSKSILFILK